MNTEKNKKLNKANLNKEAAIYLNKEARFSSWVAVTAFYSAIHFIDCKIFPLKISDNQIYKSFDDYFIESSAPNKHQARSNLCRMYATKIYASFRKLHDLSGAARYSKKIHFNTKKILECLNEIETFCIQ